MRSKYIIKRNGESLSLRLIGKERKIEIVYVNACGDRSISIVQEGFEVSVIGIYADGRETDEEIPGYLEASARLGKGLREQLPKKWHDILGNWLRSKAKAEEDKLYF